MSGPVLNRISAAEWLSINRKTIRGKFTYTIIQSGARKTGPPSRRPTWARSWTLYRKLNKCKCKCKVLTG